jgi:hypothetical protein
MSIIATSARLQPLKRIRSLICSSVRLRICLSVIARSGSRRMATIIEPNEWCVKRGRARLHDAMRLRHTRAMIDEKKRAAWIREFEKFGYDIVRDGLVAGGSITPIPNGNLPSGGCQSRRRSAVNVKRKCTFTRDGDSGLPWRLSSLELLVLVLQHC